MSRMNLSCSVLLALAFSCASVVAQTGRWEQINYTGSPPSVREHALGYSHQSNVLVLFGGTTTTSGSGAIDETWIFDVSTTTWRRVDTDPSPPARRGAVYGMDSVRNRFIIATGEASSSFNDAWAFDIESETWTEIGLGGGTPPGVRYGAAGGVSIQNPTHILVSHGFTSGGRYDDTFSLSFAGDMWQNITPNEGELPSARCLSGFTVSADDRVVMYGGCGSGGYGPCPGQDTWSLPTRGTVESTGSWTQAADGPQARNYAAMAPMSDGPSVLMVGGDSSYRSSSEAGDLEILGTSNTWASFNAQGEAVPAQRTAPVVVLVYADPQNLNASTDYYFMYGGTTAGGVTNELWALRRVDEFFEGAQEETPEDTQDSIGGSRMIEGLSVAHVVAAFFLSHIFS